MLITRRLEFSASYRNASGATLGHNWELEVTLAGPVDSETGMLIDLKDLKSVIEREVEARFDHRCLNDDTPYFRDRAPTPERFLEATQQSLGVGGQGVGSERNQPRVIINDEAQVSGHRFGMQAQERAGREIDDPQSVDAGGFERLGGTGNILAQKIPAALGIQVVLLQPAIDRRQSREGGIGLFPLPVKQFHGHSGKGSNPFQDPLRLGGGKAARLAPVTPPFGFEPVEAGLLEGVIPIFKRALGDELRWRIAVPRQGMSRSHLFQRGR